MAREAGAKPNRPAKSRARAKAILSREAYRALRRVLYDANRRGLIASKSSLVRLRSWLTREAAGSTQDLRSPFWSKRTGKTRTWIPREELVASFWQQINKQEVGLSTQFRELLLDTEAGQLKNIGPQSVFLPWGEDGPQKVAEVYKDKPGLSNLDQRALKRAIDRLVALVPTNSIRMESIRSVVNRERVNPHAVDQPGMDTHTNSGPPYYINPWKPNGNTKADKRAESQAAFEYIVERAQRAQEALLQGHPVSWNAIAAKRLAQKSDVMKRKRLVIALEKAEPVIWKTFTPQLIEKLREVKMPGGVRPFVAQLDLPEIDKDCQLALRVAESANRIVIGGDYSAYDSSLSPALIELAGSVIGKWLYKGEKLGKALAQSMANKVTLITPNKIWDERPSSMKSGSGGTNLVDSLINLLVMFYGEEIGAFKIVNCAVQGDDFFLDAIGADPEAIHEVAASFGLEAHPDKQMYTRKALAYLQRIHLHGYLGGMASVCRTLGSIMSYERMMYSPSEWNAWVDIIRALSQLENTAFSPWFETLVEFVKKGDKHSLGANLPPSEVIALAGGAGNDFLQRELGRPNKSKDSSQPVMNGFVNMAVNGVLRGESLPPLGSVARFSRVYGKRV